ncbi:MAG: phage holin family protein [Clostridiales bacterium]|nr:phage holin family protein [Clostridiales bacterium]
MEKVWDKVIKVLAAAGGAVAGALGGWDKLLMVLMSMMAADYLSGVAVALMGRSLKTEYGGLSSKVGARGLAKKGLMLLCVLVATMLDRVMGMDHAVCRDSVCWFYIANEGLSLLENMSLAGVPFPERLKELLGQRMDKERRQPEDGWEDAGWSEPVEALAQESLWQTQDADEIDDRASGGLPVDQDEKMNG